MNKTPSKTLSRAVAAVLAAAFLGFVFTAFFTMLIQSGDALRSSVQMTPTMKKTLPANPDRLDRLSARINGFTSAAANNMWLKDDMGYVNSAFQYALGKKVINTGSRNMIRLNTGHLYDLTDYKSLADNAGDIAALRNTTLKDYPFLFVYEHPTLYDPAMLPEDYAALDHSAEMAGEVLSALRSEGIPVLDSRDVLPDCGLPMNELLMFTDQHWSTLAAIVMGRAIAGRLNELTGAGLDAALLDPANLQTLRHEKLFMGKYGQRVGTRFIQPDDIVEYWPAYDTAVTRDSVRGDKTEHVAGSFREAITRADRLEPAPGKTWNTYAYTYYGQAESYDIMVNEAAPDFTILLLKDSYSAPIGRFLSLAARRVVCLDLRQDVEPLENWLAKYPPDAVVMSYSLQMLRDDEYAFQ
ncbi:MAG: hypothetical protein IKQ80_01310 [Clostridia bacterium]|nr:hypothetical protein [Clostridia bacterium]